MKSAARHILFSAQCGRGALGWIAVLAVTLVVAGFPAWSRLLYSRSVCLKTDSAQVQISFLSCAIDSFEVDTGAYPKDLSELMKEPKGVQHWRGPYANQMKDPWGHGYNYEIPGKHNVDRFDVYSAGPDGLPKNADDLTNWKMKAESKSWWSL